MNKQIVIASLLASAAATAAPVACEDAFTKQADAAKIVLDAKKTALETEKATLATLAASELTAYNTAKGRYDTQNTLMAPFNTALTSATANHKTKNDAATAAVAALAALAPKITAATTALTAAQTAETAQKAKVTAQNTVIADLTKQVELHTAEKVILDKAVTDATTDLATKTQAKTTATAAKTTVVNARAAAGGSGAKKTSTAADAGTAATAYNTAVTAETTEFDLYKVKKSAFDRDTRKKTDYTAGCTGGGEDCKAQTGDPVRKLYDDNNTSLTSTTSAESSAKSTWQTKVTAVATKEDLKNQADILAAVWAARDVLTAGSITTLTAAETTATGEVTSATAAKTTATTNQTTITAQLAQATLDKQRGDALLVKINAALTPLTDAVTVAKAMLKIETDKKAVQDAAKLAANANLADLANLKTMAQETVTRAQKKLTFYKDLMDTADKSKKVVDAKVTANATAITKNTAALVANVAAKKAAVATCKGIGYAKAQDAMKALLAKNTAEKTTYDALKKAYDVKTAWPTTGTAGADCAYPKEADKPRPKCNDGLCCGAAQKFMRDGTKLAIETCQKPDTRTYTFLPPLTPNAQVEPASQVWRFSCISGAQQLVASTAAALVATYMMA